MSTTQNSSNAPSYYHYDQTGFYVCDEPAVKHCFDEVYHEPPYNATFDPVVKPFPEKKWPKWVNGAWVFVDDYRGFSYWTKDRKHITITEIEIAPPEGYLTADPGPTLEEAQKLQIIAIHKDYFASTARPILFKTDAGIEKEYQTGTRSLDALKSAIAAFGVTGTPDGYYWKSLDNTKVPFTGNDLNDLFSTITYRTFLDYDRYGKLKDDVRSTKNIEDVLKFKWSLE